MIFFHFLLSNVYIFGPKKASIYHKINDKMLIKKKAEFVEDEKSTALHCVGVTAVRVLFIHSVFVESL